MSKKVVVNVGRPTDLFNDAEKAIWDQFVSGIGT